MKHSVRAYLERLPADKLEAFLETALMEDADGVNDILWQELLEALISRNAPEDDRWLPYIRKIKQNRLVR